MNANNSSTPPAPSATSNCEGVSSGCNAVGQNQDTRAIKDEEISAGGDDTDAADVQSQALK